MNNFANSLLHILLSWMRTLFSGLLSFAQDTSTGLFAWLGSHWFSLAVILITLGIVLDAVIYMVRWRPQYVWRSRLHRLLHRRDDLDDPQFEEGYDSTLPNFNFADTPIPDLQNDPPQEQLMETDLMQPEPQQETFEQPAETSEDAIPSERRRRSERHEKRPLGRLKLPEMPDLLRRKSTETIDARSAFHDPVYPESDTYQQEQNGDEYQHF